MESSSGLGGLISARPPFSIVDGFLLSGPERTLRAGGCLTAFDDHQAARAALAAGDARIVVGALAFDHEHPCALTAPETVEFSAGPWLPPAPESLPDAPAVRITAQAPAPAEHIERVNQLIARVRSGELDKVVAARSVLLEADGPISRTALLSRLIAQDPNGNGFTVDLSPAGDEHVGRALVGASPETLIRRHGDLVTCWPLAGSVARSKDPVADAAAAAELLESEKNQHEHAFVVDWLREVLDPLCSRLEIPLAPTLIATPDLWHLGTRITGTLAHSGSVTALDLALALHPTPAVCGTPQGAAMQAIRETEEDRGFYAGAVGWCDAAGDGDWMVAIRCAELSADRRSARAFAGGGIVAGSDAADELAETDAKLRTLLTALGM
ncbi:isochorismate synthase [Tomitella biformata]|uniref:isochorismate synthase n=1 Tax=Tomitella biformata TaxID=630403 RepID=UPI0004B3E52F|nr:isochorismate synthase [Tomitella biformata]